MSRQTHAVSKKDAHTGTAHLPGIGGTFRGKGVTERSSVVCAGFGRIIPCEHALCVPSAPSSGYVSLTLMRKEKGLCFPLVSLDSHQ